jgi:hypothetical protein
LALGVPGVQDERSAVMRGEKVRDIVSWVAIRIRGNRLATRLAVDVLGYDARRQQAECDAGHNRNVAGVWRRLLAMTVVFPYNWAGDR